MKHVHYDEVYVLKGWGMVYSGENGAPFRVGDAVYIPPGEVPHFEAGPHGPAAFLCLIPKSGK